MSNMKQMQTLQSRAPLDVVLAIQKALSSIRAGITADTAGAPVLPQLRDAEAQLLRLIFAEEEVDQYYEESAIDCVRRAQGLSPLGDYAPEGYPRVNDRLKESMQERLDDLSGEIERAEQYFGDKEE